MLKSDKIQYDVTFCDDIRQEIHGKVSLIGVYNNAMNVQKNTELIARFCAIARVRFPELTKRTIQMVMKYGSLEYPTDEVSIDETSSDSEICVFMFLISPFKVEGPGDIKIIMKVDGTETEIGGLSVNIVDAIPEQ